MKRMTTLLLAACGVAVVMAASVQAAPVVIDTEIVKRSPDAPIVSLSAGRGDGVRVGDPFWVFDDRGVVGLGEVYLVTDEACVGRLIDESRGASVGRSAALLRRSALPALRIGLLPGVTVRGKLTRVAPGHDTAWLDIGRTSGLRVGDSMLIRRNNIPISRGKVEAIEADSALVTLDRLVSNALPQAGEAIEVWHCPG